jgi:hypothetical protein
MVVSLELLVEMFDGRAAANTKFNCSLVTNPARQRLVAALRRFVCCGAKRWPEIESHDTRLPDKRLPWATYQ